MQSRQILLTGLLLGCAIPALAGTRIGYTVEGDSPVVESIEIDDGKLRINQHGSAYWILFDAASQQMTIVNEAKRELWLIDRTFAERMRQQQEKMNRKLDQMMTMLPPEVRQRQAQTLEQMRQSPEYADAEFLDPNYAADNTVKFSVRATGESRTVAGYPCMVKQMHSGSRKTGSRKEMELCLIRPGALNIPAEDLAVIEALQDFSKALTEQTEEATVMPPALAQQMGGESTVNTGIGSLAMEEIPVQTRYFQGKRSVTTSTLADVSTTAALDAARFRMPTGYKTLDFESTMRQAMDSLDSSIEMLKQQAQRQERQ